MGRCALLLRQGRGVWTLKRQYDKIAGYCHLMRIEIAKIHIDPARVAADILVNDAKEGHYDLIIVADASVLDGVVESRPSLESQLRETGLELLVISEWEAQLHEMARRQVEAS